MSLDVHWLPVCIVTAFNLFLSEKDVQLQTLSSHLEEVLQETQQYEPDIRGTTIRNLRKIEEQGRKHSKRWRDEQTLLRFYWGVNERFSPLFFVSSRFGVGKGSYYVGSSAMKSYIE